MPKPDKYGSAYDPKNGKPHPRAEKVPELTLDFDITSMIADSMQELQRGLERSVFSGRFSSGGFTTIQTPSGPPPSYSSARQDVAKWLIKAPDQRFDDIVGNAEALAQLRDAIEAPVKHSALYKAYGLKMPKGALLRGPPGCGKTMFARAMASEMRRLYGNADVEFICLSGSELQSGYVGQTEERIKALFRFAREYLAYRGHPLLIFIDEAEALLPDRTGRGRRVTWFEENQVSTFLGEMDGIRESGAFVLLATNRPESIDQAVLRDGRCDLKITVKRPTPEALATILRRNFRDTPIADGTDLEQLVFAAIESFLDPAKVILEAHLVGIDFEKEKVHRRDKHFLLEHIVSGAMAASVPARAKRRAFARDKADGVARGVTVADVVEAINGLFEENKRLEHSFALNEFRETFFAEAKQSIQQERDAA